jgi:hypothetical protein
VKSKKVLSNPRSAVPKSAVKHGGMTGIGGPAGLIAGTSVMVGGSGAAGVVIAEHWQ